MRTRSRLRRPEPDRRYDGPPAGPVRARSSSAALGLSEHLARLDSGSRTETISAFQGIAGNQAVQRLVARAPSAPVVSPRPAPVSEIRRQSTAGMVEGRSRSLLNRTIAAEAAPDGLKTIKKRGGPGVLGHTRNTSGNPPYLQLGATSSGPDGYTATVNPARTTPTVSDALYPAPGIHHEYDYTTENGTPATISLIVSDEWSEKIKVGEQEHIDDQAWAWKLTWAAIAAVIDNLAKAGLPAKPTADEAEKAARARFLADLPAKLRPTDATFDAQDAKWGVTDKESVFLKMFRASGLLRDNSGWHTPESSLDHTDKGGNRFDKLSAGSSKIPGTKAEDLMKDAFKNLK